jgi:hypothetical protein
MLPLQVLVKLAKVDPLSRYKPTCYCSHPPYFGCSDQATCSKKKIVSGVGRPSEQVAVIVAPLQLVLEGRGISPGGGAGAGM